MQSRYDYIIIGAGSAGCLLANRLSADPHKRVLLLEAGGKDDWIWFRIPVGYLYSIGNPRADWMFKTEAQSHLNGRSLHYPRGKVLGGSSAINAMIYMRGQARDYERWRDAGLAGWGWQDVLPYFMQHEDYWRGASRNAPATHAAGGECSISAQRVRWDILDAFRDAAAQSGIPRIDDFNSGDNEGSSPYEVTQRNGWRWTSARGFLDPVRHRPNLRIETGCLVDQLLFDNDNPVNGKPHCNGVRWIQDGQQHTAHCGDGGTVVLSAGAIGSPQLLLRSGIGPGEALQALGIPSRLHRPGVGQNLIDHLQVRLIHQVSGARTLNTVYHSLWGRLGMFLDYALRRSGPLSMAPAQLGLYARSSAQQERANVQFHVQALSLDRFGTPLHRFPAITTSVCNAHPTSRGQVRLRDAHPTSAPIIDPNYLSTAADQQVIVDALRLARRILAQPALARYQPQEMLPGAATGNDDAALLKAAAEIALTIFHPVGTARMGREDDAMAVLDARLRVIGVDGLRVIDASAMPDIPSGNTAAASMMIAEKGAAMLLADQAA